MVGTTLATTATLTSTLIMTTLQKTLITAVLAAAVGGVLYETRQVARLRQEFAALRQQQADQTRQVQKEKDEAAAQLAAAQAERDRAQNAAADLLKLRAEVTRLRAGEQELLRLRAANARSAKAPTPPTAEPREIELPKDSWADAGLANPQDTLRTRGWSILNGNRERFRDSVYVTDAARKALEDRLVQMAAASNDPNKAQLLQEILNNKFGVEEGILMPMMAENQRQGYLGYHILSEQATGADETMFEVETRMASAPAKKENLKLHRFGNDWKVVIDEEFIRAAR
jgi:hypothetical protein